MKDFERNRPYIVVDPRKKQKFMERLAPYRDKKLVGFCWRSGKLDPTRNLGYTNILDWRDVLQRPGLQFVNLQYGECEQELQQAEKNFGVKVIRWRDLDLKEHLDDVFALMSCLDLVATVGTAVFPMAGSVGSKAIRVGGAGWVTFGDQFRDPFFRLSTLTGEDPTNMVALSKAIFSRF
jgi:hypothetical protein